MQLVMHEGKLKQKLGKRSLRAAAAIAIALAFAAACSAGTYAYLEERVARIDRAPAGA